MKRLSKENALAPTLSPSRRGQSKSWATIESRNVWTSKVVPTRLSSDDSWWQASCPTGRAWIDLRIKLKLSIVFKARNLKHFLAEKTYLCFLRLPSSSTSAADKHEAWMLSTDLEWPRPSFFAPWRSTMLDRKTGLGVLVNWSFAGSTLGGGGGGGGGGMLWPEAVNPWDAAMGATSLVDE